MALKYNIDVSKEIINSIRVHRKQVNAGDKYIFFIPKYVSRPAARLAPVPGGVASTGKLYTSISDQNNIRHETDPVSTPNPLVVWEEWAHGVVSTSATLDQSAWGSAYTAILER